MRSISAGSAIFHLNEFGRRCFPLDQVLRGKSNIGRELAGRTAVEHELQQMRSVVLPVGLLMFFGRRIVRSRTRSIRVAIRVRVVSVRVVRAVVVPRVIRAAVLARIILAAVLDRVVRGWRYRCVLLSVFRDYRSFVTLVVLCIRRWDDNSSLNCPRTWRFCLPPRPRSLRRGRSAGFDITVTVNTDFMYKMKLRFLGEMCLK